MQQHIKTDLKIMVKEADKEKLTSVSVPATVRKDITENQVLQIADILEPIYPTDAATSYVVGTGQTNYIQNAPVEYKKENGGK